jgi:AraC-like DNA-binding protein
VGIVTQQVVSPLGCWTQSRWSPPHLAGLVEAFWYFEGTTTFARERNFPDGKFELIVHFGDPYRVIEGEWTGRCSTACFGGLQTNSWVVEAPASSPPVLGVRLHPAGAYALLATPLSEMSGLTVDLQDLAGRAAGELIERCHGAASREERLRRAVTWVTERVARSPGVDPAVAWVAGQIERREGAVAISELRERAGFSKTRLATAFRAQIGVAPKQYARILRFRRALTMVTAGEGSLADVALAAGYYDQPHMNAEFRELSGLSPGGFLAARRYPGSVSVAEVPS